MKYNRAMSSTSGILTGIALTDEDSIIGHLDLFNQRVLNLIEIMETLKEFTLLRSSAAGLPVVTTEADLHESDKEAISDDDDKFVYENNNGVIEEEDEGIFKVFFLNLYFYIYTSEFR